jgi:hypothetical protein
MDLKNVFKKSKDKFGLKVILGKITSAWLKFYRLVFIIFFLAMAATGLYFWYQALYRSNWDENKKNQYISTKQTDVNFKEDDFMSLIKEIESREANYKNKMPPIKNIFKPLE